MPASWRATISGQGTADVVVTEGFTGNIALKTAEGTARQVATYLREALSRTWRAKIGYIFASQAFGRLREKMDPNKVNGGVFLGLNGIVIKSHGSADAEGISAAIDLAYDMAKFDVQRRIEEDMARFQAAPSRSERGSGMKRSVVVGIGASLPERATTNADLEARMDTSDEWIRQRTGIEQRYIAAEGQTTADLGEAAACAALEDAGLAVADIDMIVLATSTPDHTFPATAVEIQHRLGMTHGSAFDLQAVCSGFIFALTTADAYLQTGAARRILVIGAETFSRIIDWEDRTTAVLFGDGAGAIVLEAQEGIGMSNDRGVLTSHLRSDGSHKMKLYVDGGPSSTGTVGHLRMQGREVFKHAVAMITDVIEDAFAATGLSADDIDWFVPHQANRRIIEASAKKLDISAEKVVITVNRHGNTSAASIPLALHTAVSDGRIRRGNLVLLEAMGGGFTWGSVLLRW